MRIAVTGASGFVGSHVLEALAAQGESEVVAIVRKPIGADRLPAKMEQVLLDVGAPDEAAYERMGRPDVLMHLAWNGLPNYLSRHHVESELPAQFDFLRAMVDAGLPSLLVTGTCYEYGMLSGELSEDMAGEPANPYGAAKAALYRQLEDLRSKRSFALTWARLFYLWGPRQATGSLYPLLRAAVDRGDPTFPMSPGDQLRDYLPVEAAARMLVALALRSGDVGLVNVCSGVPITVRALVEGWLQSHGWKITLDLGRLDYPSYEPREFWGSTRKLEAVLAGTAEEDGIS